MGVGPQSWGFLVLCVSLAVDIKDGESRGCHGERCFFEEGAGEGGGRRGRRVSPNHGDFWGGNPKNRIREKVRGGRCVLRGLIDWGGTCDLRQAGLAATVLQTSSRHVSAVGFRLMGGSGGYDSDCLVHGSLRALY